MVVKKCLDACCSAFGYEELTTTTLFYYIICAPKLGVHHERQRRRLTCGVYYLFRSRSITINTKESNRDVSTARELQRTMKYLMQHYSLEEIQDILHSDTIASYYRTLSNDTTKVVNR